MLIFTYNPSVPMAVHPIEDRYGTTEMRAIWSEENRFSCIVAAEIALAKAEAAHGLIPEAAAGEISRMPRMHPLPVQKRSKQRSATT